MCVRVNFEERHTLSSITVRNALNSGLVYTEALNKKNGWDMRIHVDAASGGFVAPFIYPDLEFDFRLPMVNSVSASGHK